MKILVTGASGTVGKALTAVAVNSGDEVIAWNRHTAPPDNPDAGQHILDTVQPQALVHLAIPSQGTGRHDEGRLVNITWTERLARAARDRNIPFLYVSTVMVYTDNAKGPFYPDMVPDATEGYGGEKRRGELAAQEANPNAIIARIGWQIGHGPGGNNMIDFFYNKMRDEGVIHASRKWLPATSFVEDTAKALRTIVHKAIPGVYLINSNDQWNFYAIAQALNQRHGGAWRIEPNEDFVYDQRMLDDRVIIPSLADRFPELQQFR
ncbi:MAG TPA: sugar nucleotide-binding protein [Kiritimatiellia bacterium]|nr:sugar nucleotide-binding protein [Kiritimatiellia bacterium]